MFNNQPTQVLITLHENDKPTLSQILHTAAHWPNHFNLITGNDGPYPTVTICFDGINALSHLHASGIIAGVDIGAASLFALDDLIVEVKAIKIYSNGQVVDLHSIAPTGKKFIDFALTYYHMTGRASTRNDSPRAIRRDRASGFMDLSGGEHSRSRYSRNADATLEQFNNDRLTFERPARQHRRSHVVITVSQDDAYLTIDDEGAELLERVVTEGGCMYKFHHRSLRYVPEQQINRALHSVGLSSAWIDNENNIINIVVAGDTPVPELAKLEFDIRIDSESDESPVVVLEDKDGDLYPHMAEVYDNGFRYQSDLLCGLTYANVETLNSAAKALGFNVVYDEVVGSIELITIVNNVEATEEVIPELEIKDNQILLGGVPAQVLEIGNRQFEIIFDQDLPVNKYDYAATLRGLLLGRRTKGFNSSWSEAQANILVVRLEVGDESKSVKTMRALVEASKPTTEAIIEDGSMYFVVNGVKNLVEVFEEINGVFALSADVWLEDASKELIDSLIESLGEHLNVMSAITYEVDTIPHILNLNLGKGNANRGAKQRLREIKAN